MNPNPNTINGELLVQDCIPALVQLEDASIDAVITDPPYPNGQGLFTDQWHDGIIGLYLAAKKAKNYVVFFWSPNHKPPRPPPGFLVLGNHIWHKPDARSVTPYELIIVWARVYKQLQRKVWTIPILDYRTLRDLKGHPTQKPLRLLRNLVELYTNEGDLVLDPFAGTGTTAVACKHANRRYLAIERNTEYAEFAKQRLQERTEQQQPLPQAPPPQESSAQQPSWPAAKPKR